MTGPRRRSSHPYSGSLFPGTGRALARELDERVEDAIGAPKPHEVSRLYHGAALLSRKSEVSPPEIFVNTKNKWRKRVGVEPTGDTARETVPSVVGGRRIVCVAAEISKRLHPRLLSDQPACSSADEVPCFEMDAPIATRNSCLIGGVGESWPFKPYGRCRCHTRFDG